MTLRVATSFSFLRRFRRDRSGLAALEFALILPAMLVLYIGGVELTDGISIKRKLGHVASAMSDLVAQDTAIADTTEMNDIFKAGQAIMAPYSTSLLKAQVVAITVDADKKATVSWAQALNGADCLTKGSAITVPTDLLSASSFMILVKTAYAFTPSMGYGLTGTYDMHDTLYQLPRTGKAITGPSCG